MTVTNNLYRENNIHPVPSCTTKTAISVQDLIIIIFLMFELLERWQNIRQPNRKI